MNRVTSTLVGVSLDFNIPDDKTLYVFAKGYQIWCGVFDDDEPSQWFFQPSTQGTFTINVPVSSTDNQLRIGIAYGPPIVPSPGVYEEWDSMTEILFDDCEEI